MTVRRPALRVAAAITLLVDVLLVVYPFIPGHARIDPAVYWVVVAAAALGAATFALLSAELARQARAQAELATAAARRASLLSGVAAAARSLSVLDRDQMLDVVVQSVEGLGFDTVRLFLYDSDRGVWDPIGAAGEPPDGPGPQPIGSGVVGQVWQGHASVVVADYANHPEVIDWATSAGVRSLVAAPVWCDGNLRACLLGARLTERPIDPDEVECVEILAGQAGVALGNIERFQEQNRWQAELAYQATHDVLTDLPNRTLFSELQERARTRARRSGRSAAVLLLDLDRFKAVNDSLGHDLGDKLLSQAAVRLRETVGTEGILARYGGDEFVVLMESLVDDSAPSILADRMLAALLPPFRIGTTEVYSSASIGISFIRSDAPRGHDPLRESDLAMYRAKESGKGRWKIFEADMDTRAMRLMETETQLRGAVASGQMYLAYQPIVDLSAGRMTGVEALIRWRHPVRGVLMPGEFIPVAEESGLIIDIGEWVMEQACHQVQAWNGSAVDLSVSVNLSGRQFRDRRLISRVQSVLRRTGLQPERLVLEITETIAMEDLVSTIEMVAELVELGVGIALDDFGQGSSSLAALRRFPLGSVKIDKVFVSGVTEEGPDRAIVGSVLTLANSLGIGVTAEGIETPEQMEALIRMGCPHGQGYLLSRPVNSGEVPALAAGMPARMHASRDSG